MKVTLAPEAQLCSKHTAVQFQSHGFYTHHVSNLAQFPLQSGVTYPNPVLHVSSLLLVSKAINLNYSRDIRGLTSSLLLELD
jgi:hypothetical protein